VFYNICDIDHPLGVDFIQEPWLFSLKRVHPDPSEWNAVIPRVDDHLQSKLSFRPKYDIFGNTALIAPSPILCSVLREIKSLIDQSSVKSVRVSEKYTDIAVLSLSETAAVMHIKHLCIGAFGVIGVLHQQTLFPASEILIHRCGQSH